VSDEKPIELSLEDEDALLERSGGKALPKGAYDPYDVDPRAPRVPAKTAGPAARTDLRKLSEWIKLKREIEDLKAEEERAERQGQDAGRQKHSKK
jgi:hypothetical protein